MFGKYMCISYITGETSSGKSGFINLLIGSDILPVSTLACTSTIVKIHNTTDRKIVVTNVNGGKTEVEFKTDDDSDMIKREVGKYVSLKGEYLNCRCVDIYLPLPMLKVRLLYAVKNKLLLLFFLLHFIYVAFSMIKLTKLPLILL